MKLYCICGRNYVLTKIPFGTDVDEAGFNVVLKEAMKVTKIGERASTFIEVEGETVGQYYSNVDVYVCENCGAKVAVE